MVEKEASLGIYVQSYNRYDKILTQDLFEECTYVVRKSEEKFYKEAGVKKIWAVDDELINSAIKTYWYIVDNALESNRELWVIPADITKQVNYYTNELIKQGANVLTQYSDLSIYKHINRTKNM